MDFGLWIIFLIFMVEMERAEPSNGNRIKTLLSRCQNKLNPYLGGVKRSKKTPLKLLVCPSSFTIFNEREEP